MTCILRDIPFASIIPGRFARTWTKTARWTQRSQPPKPFPSFWATGRRKTGLSCWIMRGRNGPGRLLLDPSNRGDLTGVLYYYYILGPIYIRANEAILFTDNFVQLPSCLLRGHFCRRAAGATSIHRH